MFIVDNMEIIQNTNTEIYYNIKFTGVEYLKLLNNISYTNYGQEKKNIFLLMKDIFNICGLGVDGSFDTVKSEIQMNYITSGNETAVTVIDYLLQKQFFYPGVVDSTMKFLLFDFIENNYRLF